MPVVFERRSDEDDNSAPVKDHRHPTARLEKVARLE
jgi:hypothetical protein